MNHQEAIQSINDNCYPNGKLHSALYRISWWEKRNLLDVHAHIMSYTKFLPTETKMSIRIWHLSNEIQSIPTCKNASCNVHVKWQDKNGGQYGQYCSRKCRDSCDDIKKKRAGTIEERYGVPHAMQSNKVKEKHKQTTLDNHGVEFVSQIPEVKQKKIETSRERYGVDYPMQTEEVKKKLQEAVLRNLGVINPMHSEEVKKKLRSTNLETYGTEIASQSHLSDDVIAKLDDPCWLTKENQSKPIIQIAEDLGVSIRTVCSRFKKFNLSHTHFQDSREERELREFIEEIYDGTIIASDKTVLYPKELDIYLPDLGIALEFNGCFWHSDKKGKDSQYHLEKLLSCEEKGIHLIHVWEHEWLLRKDIVKARLRSKIGVCDRIYARKCEIVSIDSKVMTEFMNNHHIQGAYTASHRYALKYNNNIVAVMTFRKSTNHKFEYELSRYATSENVAVVGGAGKLFKHFIRNVNPESVISYADRNWNNGNVYKQIGFEFSHNSKPAPHFTLNDLHYVNRKGCMRHVLAKRDDFDDSKSAMENARQMGYNWIWDCGNSVWHWTKNKGL